ncbi:MAG: 30S ribosomal protein S15 [Thaumarchaeota archaeon]|nr:30S ribosomal protein S15 [Nitrososphaerota archaeon]MBI3022475.1 30S ribosomal protein S15 [Nitrososphaerota archaeon]MCS4540077.1 30S ribosomal protein S15 [Nitrososphaerota archaeon]
MARIHSHRHGKSHQTRPTSKRPPSWLTYSADEVTALVIKLAKEGVTPSLIGERLRDEYGIPLIKPITGKSISKILAENKIFPALPPDLQNLLDRSVRVQKHLGAFKADRRNVRSLELIEAKIYRLANYYKRLGAIPSDFKYKTVVAQLA